jgi:hypothetical protein
VLIYHTSRINLSTCKSELGARYLAKGDKDIFYRNATFFSACEVEDLLLPGGFANTVGVLSRRVIP